ncbi:MAG TPA: Xaa-Pro peptidase family protein [Terriglobales bacterium]|jgi:Xaa-Pro dipeptidase
MISRRGFLQAGTIAAGSTIAAAPLMAAGKSSLPSSIAALKSMKSEARPFIREEYLQRQENARRLMQSNRLDAILLMEGTSLSYFTGIHWWGAERLFVTVLPAKGEAFYVCPAFEEGRAREQIKAHFGDQGADVRVWQEHDSPYQLVAQGFKDRGIATGSVGVEETVRFVFADGIAKASSQTQLSSATAVTAGCRMRKSAHEIELMRLAAKVTLKAYEAAYRGLKAGMTQAQFQDLISAAHTRLGFPGEASVQVGEYSAYPHGSVTPQVIREGTIILIDGGCKVEEYSSDISRTFVLGKPSDKMKKVFDIVHEAQSTALKTARPGLECQSVDAAARKVVSDGGYGPDYKFFTHRVGHGMGMDVHEWPYLVRGNNLPLEADMTFSDEPGIYIRGEFGVRLEDDMHITESGAELFTPQSPSLEDPFATA